MNEYTRNSYKIVQPEVDPAQPKKKVAKTFENIRTL